VWVPLWVANVIPLRRGAVPLSRGRKSHRGGVASPAFCECPLSRISPAFRQLLPQSATHCKEEDIRFVYSQRLLSDSELVSEIGVGPETGGSITVVLVGGGLLTTSEADLARASAPGAASEPGSAAASAEIGPDPAALGLPTPGSGSFPVLVRKTDGRVIRMAVLSHDEPLTELRKRVASHPEVHAREGSLTFLHAGAAVPPSTTPRALGLPPGGCLQVVQSTVSLTQRPSAEDLVASCPYCGTKDAPMQLRPLCPRCRSEAVLITAGSCRVGEIRWEQLLDVRVECFECGTTNVGAAFGLLCNHKDASGALCPSRATKESDASLEHRKVSHTFDGKSRASLFAMLQGVFQAD
jgi:hypothetical protein